MGTQTYQDPLLTNLAKGWRPAGHINTLILPELGVVKPTAQIADFGMEGLRLVTTVKSNEGETPTVTMNPTKGSSYTLVEHALKAFASEKEEENQDEPFNVQRDRTYLVTDLLDVSRESALATYMGNTSNISQNTTLSGGSQFGGGSDHPIAVIDTAVQTVADAMGKTGEEITLIIPEAVKRVLVRHSDVQDTLGFKYNQAQQMTLEQLAAAFGVKQVICPSSVYNAAIDGQTDSLTRIWGKSMWAVYISPGPAIRQHCFGYTPRRKAALMIDKWWDNDRKGWWIRCTDEFDQYIMDATAAYLVKNAVA